MDCLSLSILILGRMIRFWSLFGHIMVTFWSLLGWDRNGQNMGTK